MKEYKGAADSFCLAGEATDIRPYGEGHINLTLLVTNAAEAVYHAEDEHARVS